MLVIFSRLYLHPSQSFIPCHLLIVISSLPTSTHEQSYFVFLCSSFILYLSQSFSPCRLPLVISSLNLHTRTISNRPASSPSTHAHLPLLPSCPTSGLPILSLSPPFLSISIPPTDHHVSTKKNGYKAPFKDTCLPYQDLLVPNPPGQFLAATNNGRGCSTGYGGTLEMGSKCNVCVGKRSRRMLVQVV